MKLRTTSWIYRTFGRGDAAPGASIGTIATNAVIYTALAAVAVLFVALILFIVGSLLHGQASVSDATLDDVITYFFTGLTALTIACVSLWTIEKALSSIQIVDDRDPSGRKGSE
jgi:hypothetical protein